jgi:hypothetical protein
MENNHTFKVSYAGNFVCNTIARTDFEAIDKVYNQNIDQHPNIVRKYFIAKKVK